MRILPSSAPPLRDEENLHQVQRVLREQSSNCQPNECLTDIGFELKDPLAGLTENAWPSYQPCQQQVQPSQLPYRPPVTYPEASSWDGAVCQHVDSESRIINRARHLARRFRMSEQYRKYRNKQLQSTDDRGGQDLKWPDHVEEAFFRSLVKYPPMGRRQLLINDKQWGRNELIAEHILELTGEARTRKQISSHIQVLKPFVENDPVIMMYLSKKDVGHRSSPRGPGHYRSNYMNERAAFNRPITASSHAPTFQGFTSFPQTGPRCVRKLKELKDRLEIFEPIDFQMFVQRKYRKHGQDRIDRLHTYAQSIQQPLGSGLVMADWQSFEQDYPYLATLHSQSPLDCNVLVADASIAFPTSTFKHEDGTALDGVELGISFLCSSRHLSPSTPLRCRNSFYRGGRLLDEHSGAEDIGLMPSEDGHGFETQIKFGSTFWARTLAFLAGRLRGPTEMRDECKEDVASFISDINVVQEIVALSEHRRERILAVFWKFRLSSGARGRVSWRQLTLPSPLSPLTSTTQYHERPGTDDLDSVTHRNPKVGREVPLTRLVHPHPTLQSPFEYENLSASSLVSSSTWPTSLDEANVFDGDADFPTDNPFDFNEGNTQAAYDPDLDFSHLDSSAFNLNVSNVEFLANPTLDAYSQHWCSGYGDHFDNQIPLSAVSGSPHYSAVPPASTHAPPLQSQHSNDNVFLPQPDRGPTYEIDPYQAGGTDHDLQPPYDDMGMTKETPYGADILEQQDYDEAAGPDATRIGDGLTALADASLMADSISLRPESAA